MAPMLLVMRGLPGSGKTQHVVRWVHADPDARVRVTRSTLHNMSAVPHGGGRRATLARDALITAWVRQGYSVGVDDEHLDEGHLLGVLRVAWRLKTPVTVVDLTGRSLQDCMAEVQRRRRSQVAVSQRLLTLHGVHVQGRAWPLPVPAVSGVDVTVTGPDGAPAAPVGVPVGLRRVAAASAGVRRG